jgi:hypothetical protein
MKRIILHTLAPSHQTPVRIQTEGEFDELVILYYGYDNEGEQRVILNWVEATELVQELTDWLATAD